MDFGSASRPKRGAGSLKSSIRDRRNEQRQLRSEHFGAREADILVDLYPSPISFYDALPGCDLSLADFETLAVERLKLLRILEKHSQMSAAKFSDEWKTNVAAEMKKAELADYDNVFWNHHSKVALTQREREEKLAPVMRNREKDHLSHYILRLAYCSTEELRRWFITQECDLFRYRAFKAGNLNDFIKANGLNYHAVELKSIRETDPTLADNLNSLYVKSSTYYKVHFTEALDLVRKRTVYVEGGFCFVPESEMVSLVAHIFKTHLAQALVFTNKILPNLNEDERIVKVVGDLNSRYTGADYSRKDGDAVVRPDMIKPMAEKNDFPLCMRSMQAALETTHHLKYKARLQYGLFLKGIGLSLDDAIRYFRGEFTKAHVDADKFDKEYAYGIRYNYGKEGKKVNWTPWSCMRVIMESVGPGENHGCPYRHSDPELLRSLLVKTGVEGGKLNDILQLVKEGHFQKACSAQFEATHIGQQLSTGIVNHPNQFCTESVKGPIASNQQQQQHKVKTEKAVQYGEVQGSQDKQTKKEEEAADPFDEPMEEVHDLP
jgi:DNA primase large subunit